MSKKIIYTNKAPEPIGPYSQAILIDNTLYASGQIAANNLNDNITIQTEIVCNNIKNVLLEAGMVFEDVVKTTCFLSEMSDFQAFNEVYGKYFSHKPARSCVAAKELPKGALVEIEIIAIK